MILSHKIIRFLQISVQFILPEVQKIKRVNTVVSKKLQTSVYDNGHIASAQQKPSSNQFNININRISKYR